MESSNQIIFGALAKGKFESFVEKKFPSSRIVIITDENVFEIWGEAFLTNYPILNKAEVITLPAGEENKVIEIVNQVWETLLECEIGRNDLIINLGGGVITDMGGFIASTFKRGVSFINIPTSLMAQVDASTGGKTGIDLLGMKNVIGTFTLPKQVFIDTGFLDTLPQREVKSGFAEMLKHGLISDEKLWENLIGTGMQLKPIKKYIPQSIQIKSEIVLQDFKEQGLRKNLNFGHTIGHALETYFLNKGNPVTHGEAVAWGMIFETRLSVIKGLLAKKTGDSVISSLHQYYSLPELLAVDYGLLIQLMRNDKKNSNAAIKMVLLEKIGKAKYDVDVSEEEIKAALTHA